MISRKEIIDNTEYSCPICEYDKHLYLFEIHGFSVETCSGCGFTYSHPHLPQDKVLSFYNEHDPWLSWTKGKTETEALKRYIEILTRRVGKNSKILLVAPPDHYFSTLAKEKGLEVIGHLDIRDFEKGVEIDQPLDAIVFLYQFEKCTSLQQVLNNAYALMRTGGILLIVTPSLDSRPARFFGSTWTEWRPENRYYFDNITIQSILLKYGFNEVWVDKDLRWYTLAHINDRAAGFPKTRLTRVINILYRIIPSPLHDLNVCLPTSGMIVVAQKTERREQPLLSVILPVYNESATFPALINQLLAKQISGIDKEIILVESNSTDNTRQLVMEYKEQPGIKIILQDKARGKGNAVREGLNYAKGDILLIQDADLEYDLNDYAALLEPVVTFKRPFVLGSRHGGRWKMRHFNDQQGAAELLNLGHVFFTTLLNVLYHQNMKDPFTMYKVFRRDCLFGLKLECNGFDFDHELVIKLIRKGYSPLETPVNYRSRSFKEGKKVKIIRDPLMWLLADLKYRFVSIYSNHNH